MPIWFELMVLLLVTYAVGLLIGWSIWGRSLKPVIEVVKAVKDEIE